MKKINYLLFILLSISFLFYACDKDDSGDNTDEMADDSGVDFGTESGTDESGTESGTDESTDGTTDDSTDEIALFCDGLITAPGDLLILNEGGFQANNASLSTLSDVQGGIYNDLVQLGDVAQSVTSYDNKLFVVVNNSGKIEVICEHAYESIATIEGLPSPRFMAIVNESKAYVSNFYSESISIVDLSDYTVTGSIDYPIENNGFGERNNIEVVNDMAYIVDADNYSIVRINTTTDELEQYIALLSAPRDMVKDAEGNLWVFAFDYDEFFSIVNPKIYKINTQSNTIEETWEISQPVGYTSTYLQLNETGDGFYLLLNDIYESNTSNFSLSLTADIPDNIFPYGFGVLDDKIFITDPIDYSQEGTLIEINANGSIINEYTVGVAPSKIYQLD